MKRNTKKRKRRQKRKQRNYVRNGVIFLLALGALLAVYTHLDLPVNLPDFDPLQKQVQTESPVKEFAGEIGQKVRQIWEALFPEEESFQLDEVPEYAGSPYVEINGNVPEFDDADMTAESFERYSSLDYYGRCGTAYANVGPETMPKEGEERESISSVTPSGWVNAEYGQIDGGYLYNRCHLIGYQLTAENANEKNLITGTRYLNTEGMLPLENLVADYICQTGNHVLYRVTPVFEGKNLVASGVHMEAKSVEDGGAGVQFNVYCYNVQPGIEIDYATGESQEVK